MAPGKSTQVCVQRPTPACGQGRFVSGPGCRAEDRGKGFMNKAVALFTAFLFASKPIERVQALVDPGNDASRTILERAGFAREGVLRHALFDRGTFHDLVVFSILRADAPSLVDLLAPLQAK